MLFSIESEYAVDISFVAHASVALLVVNDVSECPIPLPNGKINTCKNMIIYLK